MCSQSTNCNLTSKIFVISAFVGNVGICYCYSRIASGALVPEFLPKGGSVFDPEHARAERARQRAAAAAAGHAGGHAVLGGRALGDERGSPAAGTQPLWLRPWPLHHALCLTSLTTYHDVLAPLYTLGPRVITTNPTRSLITLPIVLSWWHAIDYLYNHSLTTMSTQNVINTTLFNSTFPHFDIHMFR